jgi:hypothetical protein
VTWLGKPGALTAQAGAGSLAVDGRGSADAVSSESQDALCDAQQLGRYQHYGGHRAGDWHQQQRAKPSLVVRPLSSSILTKMIIVSALICRDLRPLRRFVDSCRAAGAQPRHIDSPEGTLSSHFLSLGVGCMSN